MRFDNTHLNLSTLQLLHRHIQNPMTKGAPIYDSSDCKYVVNMKFIVVMHKSQSCIQTLRFRFYWEHLSAKFPLLCRDKTGKAPNISLRHHYLFSFYCFTSMFINFCSHYSLETKKPNLPKGLFLRQLGHLLSRPSAFLALLAKGSALSGNKFFNYRIINTS